MSGAGGRAKDDPRSALAAAGHDIGGHVHRAQTVELVQPLLQVAQVQGRTQHAGKRPAQAQRQALVGQLDSLDIALVNRDIKRAPGRWHMAQVRAHGNKPGGHIHTGDFGQQAVDLVDTHAGRHMGLDTGLQGRGWQQRHPGQTQPLQGPAVLVLGGLPG